MAHIELSKSVLRALGEGVAGLDDGDTKDNKAADEVRTELEKLGYVYTSYNFVSQASCDVVA